MRTPAQAATVTLLLAASLATRLPAQDSSAEAQVELNREAVSVFNQVMSPFCPGFTLTNCTSSQAADLRDSIRVMLSEGKSSDEVLEFLVARYGEEIYASPPARGFNLAVWVAPFAALALGAFWAARWLASKGTAPSLHPPSASDPDIDAEAQARIDEELSKLR